MKTGNKSEPNSEQVVSCIEDEKPQQVDDHASGGSTRRRLIKGAVVSIPVLLTLKSRGLRAAASTGQ